MLKHATQEYRPLKTHQTHEDNLKRLSLMGVFTTLMAERATVARDCEMKISDAPLLKMKRVAANRVKKGGYALTSATVSSRL